MSKLIQTAGPSITQKEIDYVLDAVENGWYENWNGYITEFEEEFAKYIGTEYAIATSSCTGALHLALSSLNLKKGDEVIVPDTTWVATANVVKYVNATPVFADVEKDSWTISPESIHDRISTKTKAIIPVHLYGHPTNMDPIMEIADENDLHVIEDAAPAIGAKYKGKKMGNFGDLAAFSFQGAKLMVTGEGGMLVTNDEKIYEKISLLANQGRDPEKDFWIVETGFKYKISNIQAALGLAQLERINELIDMKTNIHKWYNKGLQHPDIQISIEKEWAKSIHWMNSIILDKSLNIDREKFRTTLLEKCIDTRPIFPPISKFPMFKTYSNPNSEYLYKRGINLPSALNVTKADVKYICENIIGIVDSK